MFRCSSGEERVPSGACQITICFELGASRAHWLSLWFLFLFSHLPPLGVAVPAGLPVVPGAGLAPRLAGNRRRGVHGLLFSGPLPLRFAPASAGHAGRSSNSAGLSMVDPRARGACTGAAPGTAIRLVPELTGLAHDGVADSLHFHGSHPRACGSHRWSDAIRANAGPDFLLSERVFR